MTISVINQSILEAHVKSIFPCTQTIVNARKETNLFYPSGGNVELDLLLPDLNIAFEFQDRYHYETTWYNQNSKNKITNVDSIKRNLVQGAGMTLIDVPCWWSGDVESLVLSILFQRPDLEVNGTNRLFTPIPLNPQLSFFQYEYIPTVGELMLASFPMENKIDSTWWMGEKYDGIRCCWSPSQTILYTRTGKEFQLPPMIILQFPVATYLDGELWFGRGLYSFTPMLVVSTSEVIPWHFLKLVAFDNPSIEYRKIHFEDRYKSILENVSRTNPFCTIAPRVKYKSGEHFKKSLESIIHDSGEGIIARKQKSLYEPGRTSSLLKIKTVAGDKEGIVTEVSKKGVVIQLPDKTTFVVPTQDVLIPQPNVGEVVTFSYDRTARRGTLPLGPKIIRIRTDVNWDDVVRTSANERGRTESFTTKPIGYWNEFNMRTFFENFARTRNKEPLNPDTWYNTSVKDILQEQSGSSVLRKLKGYRNGLQTLFPEISFDNRAFPLSSWNDITKRREFFEEFAKENDFDYLLPTAWYHLSCRKLLSYKGAATVISYHNNSISQALSDLFPNIGLHLSKVGTMDHISYFQVNTNRKLFLEQYALRNGFDPHISRNWYSQKDKILATKGAHKVLAYHGNSISQALLDLFPDIGLLKSNFYNKQFWKSIDSRRQFFEEIAKMNQFDSTDPLNWYSIPRSKIMAIKGANTVMNYHNHSVVQALMELFPQIGLEKDKFSPKFFNG